VKRARDLGGKWAIQGLRRGGHYGFDRFAEHDFANAPACLLLPRRQFIAHKSVSCDPRRVVDFGEVVVFGGEPEDGNGVNTAASGVFGSARGTDGFVKGVCRAGEESDLLARDDRDGACRQTVEIATGRAVDLIPCTEAAVLLAQHFHDAAANGRIEPNLVGGRVDAGSRRGMRVIRGYTGEIFKEGGKKLCRVGNFAEGKTVGLHRRSHDTRGPRDRQQQGQMAGEWRPKCDVGSIEVIG